MFKVNSYPVTDLQYFSQYLEIPKRHHSIESAES
jgi:hypothetical protein